MIFENVRFLNESEYKIPTLEKNGENIYYLLDDNLPESWKSANIEGRYNDNKWNISIKIEFSNGSKNKNNLNTLPIINKLKEETVPFIGDASGFKVYITKNGEFKISYSYE